MTGTRKCEICGKKERHCSEKLFFAKFPPREDICREWVKVVGKEDLVYLPIEKLHELRRVCGDHFRKRDFTKSNTRIKKRAIPRLELKYPPLKDEILKGFPLHIAKSRKDDGDDTTSQEICTQEENYEGNEIIDSNDTDDEEVNKIPEVTVDDFLSWNQPSAVVPCDSDTEQDDTHLNTEQTLYEEKSNLLMIVDDVKETQHTNYKCNNCKGDITGFRYTCVQCTDYDLCAGCETSLCHGEHYMLRVMENSPTNEVQKILRSVRRAMSSDAVVPDVNLQKCQLCGQNTEIKEEIQEPILVPKTENNDDDVTELNDESTDANHQENVICDIEDKPVLNDVRLEFADVNSVSRNENNVSHIVVEGLKDEQIVINYEPLVSQVNTLSEDGKLVSRNVKGKIRIQNHMTNKFIVKKEPDTKIAIVEAAFHDGKFNCVQPEERQSKNDVSHLNDISADENIISHGISVVTDDGNFVSQNERVLSHDSDNSTLQALQGVIESENTEDGCYLICVDEQTPTQIPQEGRMSRKRRRSFDFANCMEEILFQQVFVNTARVHLHRLTDAEIEAANPNR